MATVAAARRTPWASLAAAIVLGGLSPVIAKHLLAGMPLETLLAWRYGIAAAFILLLAPLSPANVLPRRRPAASASAALATVALLGSGLGALLFTASLLYAPAAVSNAVSKTGPLLVAFLAYVVLQENVSLGAWSLLAAMLLAAALLSAGEARAAPAGAAVPLLGAALAACAGLTRAVAEVAAKAALSSWPPGAVAAARFLGGVAVAVAAAAWRGGPRLIVPASASQWALLVTLGTVSTALPLVLYYRAMAALPVHVVAGVRTTAPIVTAIASWALLGERLNSLHLLGIAALLLAAYAMAAIPAQTRSRPRLVSLSASLLRFVAIVVAVAVVVSGAIQAWQLQSLLWRQTRAAVGRSAALVAELLAVNPHAPHPLLHSYLGRVVSERLSGPGYIVEFAYLVATDAEGTPVAWAFAPDQPWPRMAPARLAASVVARGPAAAGRRDILPATVTVTDNGQRVGQLHAGYRASVAVGPFLAVAARTAVLAAVLALLAAAAASGLVRSALAPLAAAAEALIAPRLPREPPSASVAAAPLVQWLASGITVLPVSLRAPVAAAARLPATDAASLEQALSAADDTEGLVVGAAGGWLVCLWGWPEAEHDDCLRAFAWAQMLAPAIVLLAAGDDVIADLLAALPLAADMPAGAVVATEAFSRSCDRLQFTPAPGGLFEVSEPR